jgi:MFS family permease
LPAEFLALRLCLQANSGNHVSKFSRLDQSVVTLMLTVLLFAFGEELWSSFLPKYMEALGASIALIALFGTLKDFLDAIYQYPGGVISGRIGERRALILYAAMAACGYTIYLISSQAWMIFVGVLFAMAWSSLGSPALFSMIGSAMPSEHRTLGFSWQSLLKRLPIVFAPALGGWLIARWGVVPGVRVGLTVAIALALLTAFLQKRYYPPARETQPAGNHSLIGAFRNLPVTLRRLLLSDIFARLAEGIAEIFIVIYAMNILGLNSKQFGLLVGIQMATAIAGYIPASILASRFGAKPLVLFTFLCFACFPLAVILAKGFVQMMGAFVVGGLREFGEPARKAMIVNLSGPRSRGRDVGLYYFIRNISVTPAAALGGWLWHAFSPRTTFVSAFLCGAAGTILFWSSVPPPGAEATR